MTLNLNKHGVEMQVAWKAVCDPNSDTDWALFGYEGTTFDLKLIGSGSDGIDELRDDLNANKIMYGFIRVTDPKTSLPKFVFLHWQGDSAPGTRKGMCATHLRDIERYFHGAHITINARNDDEVDEKEILDKVSKATASAFNFKEKPGSMLEEAPAPVGTAHQRIVPQKELPTMNEREKFWIQEESKEKERIQAEKVRKMSERKVLEEERKRREEEENRKREEEIKERERKISKIRDAEATSDFSRKDSSKWEQQLVEDAKDEEHRQKRAEELRKARNEEARQLIGQRSGNARAVFERNTSVGQLNFKRQTSSNQSDENGSRPPPIIAPKIEPSRPKSPVRVEPTPPPTQQYQVQAPSPPSKNANMVGTDDIVVPPPDSFSNEEEAMKAESEQIFCEPDLTLPAQQPDLIQDVAASKIVPDVTASATQHSASNHQNGSNSDNDYGVCAVALYDYEAGDDTEISFDPGQVITHIDQIDPGWWQGLGPDGNYGLFPANYVEVIDASEIEQH